MRASGLATRTSSRQLLLKACPVDQLTPVDRPVEPHLVFIGDTHVAARPRVDHFLNREDDSLGILFHVHGRTITALAAQVRQVHDIAVHLGGFVPRDRLRVPGRITTQVTSTAPMRSAAKTPPTQSAARVSQRTARLVMVLMARVCRRIV